MIPYLKEKWGKKEKGSRARKREREREEEKKEDSKIRF